MYRSREIIAKTTYSLLERLLDPTTLNSMSKLDKKIFIDTLLEYSFNFNEGTLQHKASLLHQIFREKYSSNTFKEHYLKRYPDTKVDFTKDIITDFRIFGELPVVRKYEETFSTDIKQILLTGDSIATTFEKQKQSNPDIIVDLMSPFGIKRTYQDVKSGIVKHSTRGSLDIVTFDSNKQVIPFTSQDYNLYEMTEKRLSGIKDGLIHDNIIEKSFNQILDKASETLRSEPNIFIAHDHIRNMLWKGIHCHPSYNRSIAFTFVEQQDTTRIMDKYTIYKNKFISLLDDKEYNLNKIGDRQKIYYAMLRSYKEVDRNTAKKIKYIVDEFGIDIDKEFLNILSRIIKETLL